MNSDLQTLYVRRKHVFEMQPEEGVEEQVVDK